MNAVIYARYSSDRQTEQSIEGQLRVCHDYAEKNGYVVVAEYCDRALTGRNDDRPEFQRMIEDSKKRQFDFVIVYKLDRFSRSRYDATNNKYKLRKNGVRVLSAMEAIGDNPEAIILEAMLEAIAEYYSVDLSQKVQRGLYDSAVEGNYIHNRVPYGYRRVGKKLEVDEKTAPVIQYVFAQYAAGVPKKKIMDALNEKGYRTRSGGMFNVKTFQTAFKSIHYLGKIRVGDRIFDNVFPALIDQKTFDQVQDRLKSNQLTGGRLKSFRGYLLSGKVYCGLCGSVMHGMSGSSHNGEPYHYYVCAGRRKHSGCKKASERADYIEWYVTEQTLEYVLMPERMNYIAEAVAAEYEKEFNSNEIEKLERRVAQLGRSLNKMIDMAIEAPEAARPRIYEKIENDSLLKQELELDLVKLRIATKIRFTKDEVLAWLRLITRGDPCDPEVQRKLIDTFINCVYLYDDQVVIYYNIKGGKQVSYSETMDILDQLDESSLGDSGSYTGTLSAPTVPEYEPRFIFVNGLFGIVLRRPAKKS